MTAQKRKRRRVRIIEFPRPPEPLGMRTIDLAYEREKRARAAFDETKARRMQQYDVDEKFAKSQECGHSIGRLLKALGDSGWFGKDKEAINERIGQLQGAAFIYEEIHTDYYKIKGVPSPNPRAMDMNRIGGFSTDEPSKERIDRINKRYMDMYEALAMLGRSQAYHIGLLRTAIMEDAEILNWRDGQVRDLLKALDAVRGMG